MPVPIDISIDCESWSNIKYESIAQKAIEQAIRLANVVIREGAEVSVLLTNDNAIQILNREWRGKNKPTNVLSFPGSDDLETALILGDIVVAYETTMREATEEQKSFDDHFTHLIVHGCLHLLGFDHETSEEAEEMENLERLVLAQLGVTDPYLDTSLIQTMMDHD